MLRLVLASAALTASASAQSFTYSFDPSASSIVLDLDVGLDLTGDLRGTFDAATNPAGTRTIPGLFGDPGTNERIPLSLVLGLDLNLGGVGAGGFTLDLDSTTNLLTIEGLNATLGAGTPSMADLELTFLYDTFRTLNPGSLFLGGFPLTLPLGSVSVTDITFTQNDLGLGTITPTATAGVYDIASFVPVDLNLSVELGGILGGGGGATPVGPIPILFPIFGTFDLGACDTAIVVATSQTVDETLPSPFPLEFDDLPLDLPTLLPPGQTANLLITAGLDVLTIVGTFDTNLRAIATDGRVERLCDGNANSTGIGATLEATGSTSVASADLGFLARELPSDSFGYLLMAQSQDNVPGFGGSQGTLCIGEPCFRFSEAVQNSGLLGEVAFAPDFGNLPMGQQFIEAESWVFQYWYRDANPRVTSNTTDALRVTFCR